MSFEEDDAQSCYFDAQSIAGDFEPGDQPVPGAWNGAWNADWSLRKNLSDQSQFFISPTYAKQNSTDSEDGALEEPELKKETRHSRTETAIAIRPHLPLPGRHDNLSQRHPAERNTRRDSQPRLTQERPSTSGAEYWPARSDGAIMSQPSSHPRQTRSKTISSSVSHAYEDTSAKRQGGLNNSGMDGAGRGSNEDLFLELANDQAVAEERTRPTSHGDHTSSRLSFANKRRSLPAESGFPTPGDRRPKSSGHIFGIKATSRGGNSVDLQRHVELHRNTPSHASFQADDLVSVSSRSRSGAPPRYVAIPERASTIAEQLRSPELPQYGRRRPSFGASPRQIPPKTRSSQLMNRLQDSYESPADSSEPKHSLPDSASVDSETADTVWDELDDLKSRIKKLELTGKLPQTSGAAVSTEQSERPRTATTAPTTIDSSPKHDNTGSQQKPTDIEPEPVSPDAIAEYIVGGPDAANIHPNLHGALTKAKSLLNPNLYRSLEATAADALQLAAMTGSAGPQGTALTAAAIINGVTVSDRHVRRKADTMCRNLTDLVLVLCEGKIEAPSVVSSPITLNTPAKVSPTLRYSRSSLSPNGGISRATARPLSRLEARRTSILGSQAGSNIGSSPVESGEDFSASEQESTKSYPRIQEPRGSGGRAISRLQAARQRHYEGVGEDEDPTIRPPSRAMTDIGRAKPTIMKEYSTPQRSPSLRESLAARRANAASHDTNRELSRVASLTSDSARRRFLDPSTPPVLEEEGNDDDYQAASQSKRRVTSYGGAYGTRRAASHVPTRSTSLSQSREVMVE